MSFRSKECNICGEEAYWTDGKNNYYCVKHYRKEKDRLSKTVKN